MRPVPETGKKYYCYDDGKVWPSREYRIEVIEVIPFSKAGEHEGLLELWECNRSQHGHLFDETDFFIKGISYERPDKPQEGYLARTRYGTWFGLGEYRADECCPDGYVLSTWFSGLLDVTGEFYKQARDLEKI